MKKNKEIKVKAWCVLGTKNNKGGLEYSDGYPMIYIQKVKPIVWKHKVHADQQAMKVVPCVITYTAPLEP